MGREIHLKKNNKNLLLYGGGDSPPLLKSLNKTLKTNTEQHVFAARDAFNLKVQFSMSCLLVRQEVLKLSTYII